MITAAMLLLISDWLVIAGNYGPGGGGGGHLQERRLLDKPGRSNWAGGTELEDSRNDSQAVHRLGRSEVHVQKSPTENIAHERTQEEIDKVPQNDDKSFSLEEASRGAALEGSTRNITLTPAMLKPLFRVHLDEGAQNGSWSRAPVSPNQTPPPSNNAATDLDWRLSKDTGVKSDNEYVNDEDPTRSNPSISTKMINFGQAGADIVQPSHATHRPGPTLVPNPVPLATNASSNAPHAAAPTGGLFVTGVPLLRKGAVCEAFEKRCENGMCVSHIMPCPQKACPVTRPYRCRNNWQCVSLFKRCDGQRDCEDGSDETGCDGLSYRYSHNRRVVVVATVIVVVLGVSLFCCVLIHVYRTAQINDPVLNRNRRRRSSLGADSSPTEGHDRAIPLPSTPWRALLRMRSLLPYLGPQTLDERPAGPSSLSFQSMSSVTQPFLSQHGGRGLHQTQSETLQSFLSAGSETGPPVGEAGSEDQHLLVSHRSALEALQGPPPPYEEVVDLGPLSHTQSSSRAGLYQDRGPPPTYESIFCIEV